MSKPRDKTSAKLREHFDELSEIETASIRKDIREARRNAKKAMTKHNRNQDKRALRDALRGEE